MYANPILYSILIVYVMCISYCPDKVASMKANLSRASASREQSSMLYQVPLSPMLNNPMAVPTCNSAAASRPSSKEN